MIGTPKLEETPADLQLGEDKRTEISAAGKKVAVFVIAQR